MSSSSGAPPLTRTEWLICFVAALGFAFDIYELLMLPLIAPPALAELLGVPPGSPAINAWVGWMFWVPALAGGIFGLLGGYLTDLFGRRRVLTWSILLYAFSALANAFSTSPQMFLFFRCTTFVGVSVEFVAAVAWLAELFPEPRRREKVLGWNQAFSSVGGLMVTGAYYLAVHYAETTASGLAVGVGSASFSGKCSSSYQSLRSAAFWGSMSTVTIKSAPGGWSIVFLLSLINEMQRP